MKRLIVGNWKMNLNPGQASVLVKRLEDKIKPHPELEVVLCPPFIDLYPLAKDLDRKRFKLGAQNIHYLDEGPYTGEISAAMLKGIVDYAIVGHSERRAMGEDDNLIAKKLAAALRNGITPILCVGETLQERRHGLSQRVVVDQLSAGLHQLTAADIAGIVIAYEPVWAINHGQSNPVPATPDEFNFVMQAIRTTLEELYGEDSAAARLLYGASVDPDHCRAILQAPHVEGLLVGSASLNYHTFADIVNAAASLN